MIATVEDEASTIITSDELNHLIVIWDALMNYKERYETVNIPPSVASLQICETVSVPPSVTSWQNVRL